MHISVGEAISQAIAVAGDDAAERTVVTGGQDDHRLVLDVPPRLAVVALRNLIVNALRYSPASSQVEVEVLQPAPGQARFVVSDRGKGMDPDEIPDATRRFWRAPQPQPGSGLGLTLVEAAWRSKCPTVWRRCGQPTSSSCRPGTTRITPCRPSCGRRCGAPMPTGS